MDPLLLIRMVTSADGEDVEVGSPLFWVYAAISAFLVVFAGIMSGLTLGLMSMSPLDLEVLMQSGTPKQQKQATAIYPVVKQQHHLLVTLLLCNAGAMEALPIFLDRMANPIVAVMLSVTLVLLFGEIIPQAICSRFGLAVGSSCILLVKFLMIACYPIAFPIGKLLDYLLGHEDPLFRRNQLKAFVSIHGMEAGRGGELTTDETTIISGALDLTTKTAGEAMTPIESTFSIDVNAKLDWDLMGKISARGHSRVPVYQDNQSNIIGVLLVKSLLFIRPEDETPVSSVSIRRIPRMEADMPLYNVLNEFQKGSSHMAAVVKTSKVKKEEEQQQVEESKEGSKHGDKNFFEAIMDHFRGSENGNSQQEQRSLSGRSESEKAAIREQEGEYAYLLGDSGATLPDPEDDEEKGLKAGEARDNEAAFKEQEAEAAYLAEHPELGSGRAEIVIENGQSGREGKTTGWRARTSKEKAAFGPGWRLKDLFEGAEVVGIITLEDVIEELLQEEIVDETDEYIDVHRKIRVAQAMKKQASTKDGSKTPEKAH